MINNKGLKQSGIEKISEFNWIEYFKYNNSHLLKLDFSIDNELSDYEKQFISPSIKAFQLGEGSKGVHLMKCVKNYTEKTGYYEYTEIMKWFVTEENRHSQTLKKYMQIYDIAPDKRNLLDNIFRLLRKLTGLECEIIVLVTAEMIALPYYTALSDSTNSTLLKTICAQMLNDELKHIVLQSDTLHRISLNRNELINNSVRVIRKILMSITSFVVYHKFSKLFTNGNYSYKKFKYECKKYLSDSICIEKTGAL